MSVGNDHVILENIFPKLEHFAYYRNWRHPTGNDYTNFFPTFISRHVNLKKLELTDYSENKTCKNKCVEAIANSCHKLEKLKISCNWTEDYNFLPLQTLMALKVLRLQHVYHENLTFITYLTHLTELLLLTDKIPMDKLVDIIRQLTKLELFTVFTPIQFL